MKSEGYYMIPIEEVPQYITRFSNKKVALIGGGAVGGDVAEICMDEGRPELTIIDFDKFEYGNRYKSTKLYNPKADVGKNKAVALAERMNERVGYEYAHGIDASITCFGPVAFAQFDVVILALDNYAAKVFFNQLWLQIPKEKRPLVIMGGTSDDCAQSNCVDGSELCIRCLFAESWLKNSLVRTSCTGVNYRDEDEESPSEGTGSLPPRMCADLIMSQCKGYFMGHRHMINKRLMYTPYPNIKLEQVTPMRRKDCPDCRKYHAIEDAKPLEGFDVLHTTVGELLDHIKSVMPDENFEIYIPSIEFGNITYQNLIRDDYCRCCGRLMPKLYRHEFRVKYEDLLCEPCKNAGCKVSEEYRNTRTATNISAITVKNCDEILRSKILYEIGFVIGSYIHVVHKIGLDYLDGDYTFYTFYCEKDPQLLRKVTKLEG